MKRADAQLGRWPFRKSRFAATAAQAKECGFELQHRGGGLFGMPFYQLGWWNSTGGREFENLTFLADVEAFIQERIAACDFCRPGDWYLHWHVVEFGDDVYPWCRWRRWVRVQVIEGKRERSWIANELTGVDPTPYPSPQAAIATSGLLGLEWGARVSLSATYFALGQYEGYRFPTPAYSDEALEELILDCARAGRNDCEEVARQVAEAALVDPVSVRQMLERMGGR